MDVNTRNRAQLKSYFVKNSIPTESNFAELIDGMLNQKDDGVVKLPGNPLTIEAAGDSASEKKALMLYQSFGDANPAWTLSLNPRTDPKDPNTAKLGLNISDGEGNSRLFIDRNTGNIGIGTTSPRGHLDVRGLNDIWLTENGKQSGQQTLYLPGHIFMTPFADGSVVYVQARRADNAGTAELRLRTYNNDTLTEGMHISGSGNVGIGTTSPGAKLDVQGSVSIGTGQNNQNYKLVLRGPNQPGNANSYQDLSYEFAGAGSTKIRAYRGGSWDTYLQFLTNAVDTNADRPQVRLHIDHVGNVGIGTTNPTQRLTLPAGAAAISLGDNIFVNGYDSTGRITNNAYISNAGTWVLADASARATTIELRDTGVIEMYGTVTAGATDWRQMFGFSASANTVYFPSGRVSIGTTSPDGVLTIIIPGRGKWVFQTDGNLCYYGNNGRNWCATSSTSNLQL